MPNQIYYSIITLKNVNEYFTEQEILKETWIREDDKNYRMDSMHFDFCKVDDIWGDYVEFQPLTRFKEKEAFVLASLCEGPYTKSKKELDKINQSLISWFPPIKLDDHEFKVVYTDRHHHILSNKDLIFNNDDWYYKEKKTGKLFKAVRLGFKDIPEYYGNLNDNVKKLLSRFLKETGITLKEFITNKKYLVLANVNEATWKKYEDYGIIDTDNIESEYRSYLL